MVLKIGVFSWNIGKNIKSYKIKEIVTKIKILNSPEILILGFQETPPEKINKLVKLLKEELEMYDIIEFKTTCVGYISYMSGFGICTFVFKKKNLNIKVKTLKSLSFCGRTGTKGFVASTIKIEKRLNNPKTAMKPKEKSITIDLVNTHMPFKSFESSKEFEINLKIKLLDAKYHSENQILFGDLNTRSLLTNDCYEKNIKKCKTDSKSNYCKLSKYLESLDYNNTTGNINFNTDYFTKTKKKNKCFKINNNCSIRSSPTNDQDMIKLLIERDVIGNPPFGCKLFNNFNEHPIKFFPTYKRNIKNGRFQLSKKSKGRLPGYADRILYKTYKKSLKPKKYTSLNIKGSDHIPIYKLFDLKI